MSRLMSDTEIRHRKKIQGHISQVTGALGLTALAGTALATKRGGAATKAVFRAVGKERPKALKPKNIRRHVAPVLATSAGVGGVGAFNFASYTGAESRKRKTMAKRDSDPFEINKVGHWKTIEQRERTQTRDRKAMRGSAAAGTAGAALATAGYHSGDKAAYKRTGEHAKSVEDWRKRKNLIDPGRKAATNKTAAKAFARMGPSTFKGLSPAGKAGVATIAGAAAVGGAAKGQHTYQQHKINQRRRKNFRKPQTGLQGL